MFESILPAPPDPILGLTDAFKKETHPKKVNLGVGVYQDDSGNTPILPSVKEAERRILESLKSKSYLPIPGSPRYGALVQELALGAAPSSPEAARSRTAHTPGGTGALRVGADFLKEFAAGATVWLSTPTWANHNGIFQAAGFKLASYPYYDPATMGLDFPRMREALNKVPKGDIVLLHVCCHNPTGVDPTDAQWDEIAAMARTQGWVPFLDFAYQGFGVDPVRDRYPTQALLKAGVEFFVSSSFSKNFGLYQDRTGAFTLVGKNERDAEAAFSHVKKVIRVLYSNPAAHGGHIVETILTDAALRSQWEEELAAMRDRIKTMRHALVDRLKAMGVERDFSFIQLQKGMFSFSGLTDAQVEFLREKKGIYMVKGGRMNVAGIMTGNLEYLCESMAEALKTVK